MGRIFTTRGPVDPENEKLYVVRRDVDDPVRESILRGDIVALIGPRQTGKTSFMHRLRVEYQTSAAYEPIWVDISPVENKSETAWYEYLFAAILTQIRPRPALDSDHFDPDNLGFRKLVSRLTATAARGTRIVLMLDELGSIPEEVRHAFLSTIREIYNARFIESALRHITFVLGGTYLPESLIDREAVSPFNVARRIYTGDSDRVGVKQLVSLLAELAPVSQEAIDGVYDWTHGHLYFTQRICEMIEELTPLPSHITAQVVNRVVETLLSSGDINFSRVVTVLEKNLYLKERLGKIHGGELNLDYHLTNQIMAQLDMLGVTRADENGRCIVRNRIYGRLLEDYFKDMAVRNIHTPAAGNGVLSSEVMGAGMPSPVTGLTTSVVQPPPSEPQQIADEYDDFSLVIEDNEIKATTEQEGESEPEPVDLDDKRERLLNLSLKNIESGDEKDLQDIGEMLFEILFPRSVVQAFEASLARARQAARRGVRIRLTINNLRLAAWPWELLYYPGSGFYLSNSSETAFSRYLHVRSPQRPINVTHPLSILVITSSPQDLPRLQVKEERRIINDAWQDLSKLQHVTLEALSDPTLEDLRHALDNRAFSVVHFIGHGDFREDRGAIALVNKDKTARLVKDTQFATLFTGNRHVGLVVLNACQGGTMSSSQAFCGMAPALLQQGIPAVVAMQFPILDTVANLFSREFYHYIATGWPVDAAIQKTRNAIYMERPKVRDFATPVLFMRSKDGVIFAPH